MSKFEFNSKKRWIVLSLAILVIFVIGASIYVVRTTIRNKKSREAVSPLNNIQVIAAPSNILSPVLSSILKNGTKYSLRTDGNLEITIEGIKYVVSPEGKVYKVNDDGSVERITNPAIVSTVLSNAVIAAKSDPMIKSLFDAEKLLSNINVEDLTDTQLSDLAKAYGLNPDTFIKWARNRQKVFLSEYLHKTGDVDIDNLSEAQLTGFGTDFINEPYSTFHHYIMIFRTMLTDILAELNKDVELSALSPSQLALLADYLGIKMDSILDFIRANSPTLANYLEDGNKTPEEREKQKRQSDIEAIKKILDIIGSNENPEDILDWINKNGMTVDEWIRDTFGKMIDEAKNPTETEIKKADKDEVLKNEEVFYSQGKGQGKGPLAGVTDSGEPIPGTAESNTKEQLVHTLGQMIEASREGNDNEYLLTSTSSSTETASQNGQAYKSAFLNEAKTGTAILSSKKSDNMLAVGTVISATTITGINTDLPGEIIARVNTPVYDSFTMTNVIIPKNTILVGRYDSSVTYAQKRILVTWQRLVLPNGYVIAINGYQGIDNLGYAGYTGKYNGHVVGIIGASVLSTALNVAATQAAASTDVQALKNLLTGSTDAIRQTASKYLDKEINRQPTNTLDPGTVVKILVNDTTEFPIYTKRYK